MIFKGLLRSFFWATLVAWSFHNSVLAENVPAPSQPNTYYYMEIPPGGLIDFMRWRPSRIPLVSHHRGGPVPGFAENSIEAMQNALQYGPGLMEVDVAQLGDGNLILMHDDTLDRTTTAKGPLQNRALSDLKSVRLLDNTGKITGHRIPTLRHALDWARGRAILTLDIKKGTDFMQVVHEVEQMQAQDYVIAIAYTLDQAKAFAKAAPWMMISITMRNSAEISAALDSGIAKENIVAWTGTRPLNKAHYDAIHAVGWRAIAGTLGNPETSIDAQILRSGSDVGYLDFLANGADIIATDRFWAVQSQIRNPNIFVFVRSKSYR